MKKIDIKELKCIHEWVRNCSIPEVVFIAFLLLPLIMLMYGGVVKALSLEDNMNLILIVALFLYVISIIIMKINQGNKEKYGVDLQILIERSKSLKLEYFSFKTILDLDKKYSETYIRELIRYAPSEITIVKLKEGEKGIKLLKYPIFDM